MATKEEELNRKMKLFASNIEKYMDADGISDEQMAALLGIKVRTLKSKLKDPRRFTLDEIVRITEEVDFGENSFKETFCFKKGG